VVHAALVLSSLLMASTTVKDAWNLLNAKLEQHHSEMAVVVLDCTLNALRMKPPGAFGDV
jgi:hypothetical protein